MLRRQDTGVEGRWTDLQRSRRQSQDDVALLPDTLSGVAIHIQKNIDACLIDPFRRLQGNGSPQRCSSVRITFSSVSIDDDVSEVNQAGSDALPDVNGHAGVDVVLLPDTLSSAAIHVEKSITSSLNDLSARLHFSRVTNRSPLQGCFSFLGMCLLQHPDWHLYCDCYDQNTLKGHKPLKFCPSGNSARHWIGNSDEQIKA